MRLRLCSSAALRFVLASLWALWLIRLPVLRSADYTFTTIAGSAGSSGSADGTNSEARFNFPTGIAVDEQGIIYVADLLNHTIRKVAPVGTNWVVSTIAGLALVTGSEDGDGKLARFNRPNGVAVAENGDIWIADLYNDTIRRIEARGTNWVVSTIAGSVGVRGSDDGVGSQAQFWSPAAITPGLSNKIYVADMANFTIRELKATEGNWLVSTVAGTALFYGFSDGLDGEAEFNFPRAIAADNAGVLYVADSGNNAVRQVAAEGEEWMTTTVAGFSGDRGARDGSGSEAMFDFPVGIAVDNLGSLFVADLSNHTIRRIDPSGTTWMVSTVGGLADNPGTDDGPGGLARFNKPWGIAVDRARNLYVADYSNHTVRKGTPSASLAPVVQIDRSGAQIVLSWPAAASDYLLETSSTFDPVISWVSITNGIALSGDSFVLTNNIGESAAFFRLHKR